MTGKTAWAMAVVMELAGAGLGTGMGILQNRSTRAPRSRIELVYQPQANGDYRLFLFGGDRSLVCEEQDIRIVQQGDAVNPVVLECSHGKAGAGAGVVNPDDVEEADSTQVASIQRQRRGARRR